MAFSVEALDSAIPSAQPIQPMAADKVFTGYDPAGTTSVTNSPIVRPDAKQEPTIEGKETVSSPVTEETVTLSPKISAIARKEQAQRKREFELRQREKALEAKLADADKYTQLKAKLDAKDFAAAEELGISYDEYAKWKVDQLNSQDPGEQRYRKVETELEQIKKNQEDQVNKDYQANQALWKQEIQRVVDGNEEFSTIKDLGAHDLVLKHINDSFDEDNVELTAEQAAKEIEAALFERAEKFASVTKIKSRPSGETKVLGPPKNKTITQDMTVTSKTVPKKPLHMMSESEQWAEATRRYEAEKLKRMGR